MDDNRTTAERLRALIEETNIPYIELERLSGVPKSAIQRYASGVTKKIPLDRIFRIADALGVSPYDLAGSDRPWGSADLGLEYAKRDFLGNPLPSDDPSVDAQQDLFDDPDRKALLNLARHGSPEAVRQVAAVIDALRATNPDFYDGDDPA